MDNDTLELQALVEQLTERVQELERSTERAEHGTTDAREELAIVGRRGLMKAAAGAAVGAAALVAMPTGRAAAANGDNLEIGNRGAGQVGTQSATSPTQINYTGTEDIGFVVQSGSSFSATSSSFDAALAGWTSRNVNPIGVYGFSSSSVTSGSIGVLGRADGQGGAGVRGDGGFGQADGVVGRANSSARSGVHGEGPVAMRAIGTTTGIVASGGTGGIGVAARGLDAVEAEGTRYGVTASGESAALHVQANGTTAPPELTDTHEPGEIRLNNTADVTTGDLWVCVQGGDPGVWRRLAGPSTAGSFVAIDPGRAYDSRQPQPEQGIMVNPASRVISVLERRTGDGTVIPGGLVPAGATAISYNLTVTRTVGRGFVSVEPGTATEAVSSAINWTQTGQTVANAGIVKIAPDGTIRLFAEGAGGSTDVIIDVTGYWL